MKLLLLQLALLAVLLTFGVAYSYSLCSEIKDDERDESTWTSTEIRNKLSEEEKELRARNARIEKLKSIKKYVK